MRWIHGGDWAGFEEEYACAPLDFSANVSPLGLPEGVRQAAAAALERADRYPDPLCRALCGRIAARHGLSAGAVLCGNGAADLIFRLAAALRPRRALVTAPTFAEYEQALRLYGSEVRRFPLDPRGGFAVTEALLDEITPELDVLFLCEPNNPTGRTTPRPLLLRILEKCAGCGTLLAVDECFNEFLEDPAAHTLLGQVETHPNLLIFKAFTKSDAMAGLRLGYALCSDAALLERMRAAGPPWAVSTVAQAAGLAALEEQAYHRALRALIRQQRPRLAAGLTALGFEVCEGEANYLLFHCGHPRLAEEMRKKGVLIRDCANYAGLAPGWFRVAVRTGEENDRLLEALKEVL